MDKRRINNNRQKGKKKIAIHKALHPQADVDSLNIPRIMVSLYILMIMTMISAEDHEKMKTESLKS